MNIALVDDMESDRIRLEHILREYDRIHHLGMSFYHYADGETFLKEYLPFRFAVIFLDVFMDGISGVETAQKIREVDEDAVIVFTTTSEAHRPDAFSVFASSYISKPCQEAQLFRVLDHIFRIKTGADKRFSFSFDRKDYSLSYADIVSIETDGNYLSIIDRMGKNYRTRMTFSAAANALDGRFLTLMKGIIVNMDYIVQISDGRCLLSGGGVFPLHVKNQKELVQKWLNYKFAKIRERTVQMEDGICL